jgi:2-keto-4-pentenoate hydratase
MSSPTTSSLAADPRVRRGMSAQLSDRRRRLDSGERSLGWKVGFGSADAMERLGIDAPLVGFLTDRSLIDPANGVSLSGWAAPALEPEVAVHVGTDLRAGDDLAAAQSAIAALGPAFELVDIDPPPREVEAILAGNIFQRNVALGAADSSAPAAALRGRVTGPGGRRGVVEDPQAVTGDLVGIVRHVADLLGSLGEMLRAGEVVICGSIVSPIAVAPSDVVAYALDPVGGMSIRLDS